jgi:hypothetical protein
MTSHTGIASERDILLAFFAEENTVQRVLDRLVEDDFPLDQVSLLARSGGSGDDPLGVYYAHGEGRIKGWGRLGAIWGGLLGGMVGLFVLPGVGPLMIAGPLIEALLGAGVGGALGAGGAALSEVSLAIHRMGVPAERLQETERHIKAGHYVLSMIVDKDQAAKWQLLIGGFSPMQQWRFPFLGIRDALHGLL